MSTKINPSSVSPGPDGETRPRAYDEGHDQIPEKGRSEFLVIAILVVIGAILLSGVFTVSVVGDTTPGPLFVPIIVGVAALVVAVALSIDLLAKPRKEHKATHIPSHEISNDLLDDLADTHQPNSDVPVEDEHNGSLLRVAILTGVMILAGFLLPYLGWTLTAAALFYFVAAILHPGPKRHHTRLILAGLIVGSVTYLAFGFGLGLNLPAGIIGGS